MGEHVTINGPDGAFMAYIATPAQANGRALVVIQEIFGVNKVMRDLADAYAAEGYFAVVPDLFWRIQPGIDITAWGFAPPPEGRMFPIVVLTARPEPSGGRS